LDFALRFGIALWGFWDMHSHLEEGLSWLTRLLALPQPSGTSSARAQVLAAAGYLALLRGQEATAQQLLDASLSASRELNDSAAEATALFFEAAPRTWLRPAPTG
jgi:hypothetical protein